MTRSATTGVLVVVAAMAIAHLFATPAMWPVDEVSHVAYADHLVSSGRLPTIDTPYGDDLPYPGVGDRMRVDDARGNDGRLDIWTSNHPPLVPGIQGIAAVVGRTIGTDTVGLVAARLTSTAFLVLAVWLTMQLALTVLGDRPRTALLAGLLVGLTPSATHLGGVAFTDSAAMAATTACLLVGARAVLGGPSPTVLRWGAAVAGLAALTRVSALPAVVAMLGMVLWAVVRDPDAGPWMRTLRRWAPTYGVALVPAGLFFLRNLSLYGSVTATEHLFEKFGRDPNATIAELVGDQAFWWRTWHRLWADPTTGHWTSAPRTTVTEWMAYLLVVMAIAALVVRWRRQGLPLARPGADSLVVWAAMGAVWTVQLVAMVEFHASGGSHHGRYLLPAHAVVCLVIAAIVAALPRGRRLATGAVVGLVSISQIMFLVLIRSRAESGWDRGGSSLLLPEIAGDATPLAVGLLVATAGIVLARTAGAWAALPDMVVADLAVPDLAVADPSAREQPQPVGETVRIPDADPDLALGAS